MRLETDGVTDDVARSDYFYKDTWSMAEAHLADLKQAPAADAAAKAAPRHWVEYFKGLVFALPLAICCLAMLQFRFSLWGGDVSADMAAAVGLGTVSSFVVTGAFIQAMARRALFYAGLKEYAECAATCFRWCVAGMIALLLTGAFGVAACAWYALLPASLDLVALAMHVALGALWLGASVLYILERGIWISAAVVAGIALTGLLHAGGGVPLINAQMAGIVLAALLSFLLGWRVLARLSRKAPPRRAAAPVGRSIYIAWPYLIYGFCYYAFLFADRLIAWTAGTAAASLSLQFRGEYEVALDVALFAFVLQVGWVQYSLSRYRWMVAEALEGHSVEDSAWFNLWMRNWYLKSLAAFLPAAILLAAAVHAVGQASGLLSGTVASTVVIWALAGYGLVVIGLRNVSILFSLSRPAAVLPAIAAACAVTAGAGYLLSRIGEYHYAAAGFALGALAFAALSTSAVLRRFRTLDYQHYASAL